MKKKPTMITQKPDLDKFVAGHTEAPAKEAVVAKPVRKRGRPPKRGSENTKPLYLRLNEDLVEETQNYGSLLNKPMVEIADEALRLWLKKHSQYKDQVEQLMKLREQVQD